jgi:hypothetical protein
MLTSSGLLCKAIPQTSLLIIKTSHPVTTQTNRTHNPASKTALIVEVMAVTVVTTSTALTDACQVQAQMPRLAGLVDEVVALHLPSFQTCHGRQRPAQEAAAPLQKRHVHSRPSHPKHLLTLHLSMLMTIHFDHPRICV